MILVGVSKSQRYPEVAMRNVDVAVNLARPPKGNNIVDESDVRGR